MATAATGLGLAGAAGAADAPALLPESLFYRAPDLGAAKLSPSGRLLAVGMARGGRQALGLVDLEAGTSRVLVQFTDRDVRDFHWLSEQRLLFDLVDGQRGTGDQPGAPGLYLVQTDDGEIRTLIQSALPTRVGPPAPAGRRPLEARHRLLHVPEDDGQEVIVGRPVAGSDWSLKEMVPLRLNVDTQRTRPLAEGLPIFAQGWLFDSRGEPRVAIGQREGTILIYWRGPGSTAWRELARHRLGQRAWIPHSVDDSGGLYVTVPEGPTGTLVLKRLDLATAQPTGDALVRTEGFDFTGRLLTRTPRADGVAAAAAGPALTPSAVDAGGRAVVGVHVETDAALTLWFDPQRQAWQDETDRALPGRVNRIDCRRCATADPVVLVHSASDQLPGEYHLFYPGRSERRWNPVGRQRRDVDPARMASLDFHRVTTRDGLAMPVWVTLPPSPGAAASGAGPSAPGAGPPRPRRPAVVLVHGGPWVRGGHWGWDANAQFLASRGYVVIEPEFRGSTGFGSQWRDAGNKQWGQAMQDDVADALRWAVEKGWVDKDRVCIAGASYGGYAALMGPIRHPGLYRCVVSWVGVTDLPLLFDNSYWSDASDESRFYTLPQLVGDPKADAAMLSEQSPVNHADKLTVPVFMAYGAEDRRVQLAHGERMREALIKAGRPPEWVVYPDEAHGWLKPENRFDFARRMEAFLAKHLK